MTDLSPIVEHVRDFVVHSVPPGMQERAVVVAAVFLAVGIGLSVLGAKLARPVLTVFVASVGGLAGVFFARNAGFHEPVGQVIGGAVGMAMFGTVALLTFRIWVGVITALVLSTIALGSFGYDRLAPHVAEFEGVVKSSTVDGGQKYVIPTPAEQQSYRDRTPGQWAQEFWTFATGKDANLGVHSRLVGTGALAIGLFLGVVAMRWMLILSTSAAGTLLVTSGVATLVAHAVPGSYQAFARHPGILGMGIGAFMVTSLILQTLLTRKAPAEKAEAAV